MARKGTTMAREEQVNPIHPALAASWKDTLLERKVIELQRITEIDEQLATDFLRYLMKDYEKLIKDINGI